MSASKQDGSNIVVIAALLANLGIAVAKFVAASITGSSSMLTEGFHSVVDSFNQLLLLYGCIAGGARPTMPTRSAMAANCISGASSSRS